MTKKTWWVLQILWRDYWTTIARGFKTRDDAEWEAAGWKQANRCFGDPFRAVEVEVTEDSVLEEPCP